jgi:glycosyltransferase involved in cell wall biosynthesis
VADRGQPIGVFLPGLGRDAIAGGAERVAVTLAEEFLRSGRRTDLLLSVTHPGTSALVPPGVRIVDLHSPRLWTSLGRLVAYRWRERPRAVLSLMPLANILNVLSALLGPRGSRAVLSEHSSRSIALDGTFSSEGTRLLHPLSRLLYPRAAAIVGCSSGVAAALVAAHPRAEASVVTIANPIPPAVPSVDAPPHPWLTDPEVPCLLAVGRLHEAKDPLTLVRTLVEVNRARPARLLVLGDGDCAGELAAAVEQARLGDRIQLLGHRDDARRFMAAADLLLHTARREGFSLVIAEALAEGLPVVATDCRSGPREILAGGTYGRLAPVGDAPALARAVLATLEHPPDPMALRTRAADFAPEAIAQRYLAVLDRVSA